MPRRLFIGLFLLPLPLFAAPPKDELAYAVGARLGMRLQQEMPGLELSELLLGLRQAYRGEALEIPPERIEQLLLQHENATTETPRTTPAEARFLANEKARFGVRELTGGSSSANYVVAKVTASARQPRYTSVTAACLPTVKCSTRAKAPSGSPWTV